MHAASGVVDRSTAGDRRTKVAGVHVSPYLNSRRKRAFDIALSLVGLFVLGLILPIVGFAVCLTSRGPIFHSRARVGKDDVLFSMIKFRTMVRAGGEDSGQLRTQTGDPRITKVGTVLRKTYIDEIPQFLNVLRGEMSIVGPRPEFPELARELVRARPEFAKRTAAKPGITGLAQVQYVHATDDEQAANRISYDLKYIRHASLRLDVKLVVKTLRRAARFGGY